MVIESNNLLPSFIPGALQVAHLHPTSVRVLAITYAQFRNSIKLTIIKKCLDKRCNVIVTVAGPYLAR